MMTVEQALDREAQEVLLLRMSATLYLRLHDDVAPLGDVLAYLKTLTRSDATISKALAYALSRKDLDLDGDRYLRVRSEG